MRPVTPPGRIARRFRHLVPLVAIALLGCLGACEYESKDASRLPSPAPATEAGAVPPGPDGGGTATIPPLPDGGEIDAGTYLVLAPGYPVPFEITVPAGWSSEDGDGLRKDDPDHPDDMAVFVGWWSAGYVPTDACAWEGALVRIDPSAKAFVDAVTAQASTASTPPVEVKVGNYSGFEFDHAIEGNVDVTACDRGKFCIHSELSNECTRWYSTREEHEAYRVVDLYGQRAVSWVVQFHEAINPELTNEARTVFDSIVYRSGQ